MFAQDALYDGISAKAPFVEKGSSYFMTTTGGAPTHPQTLSALLAGPIYPERVQLPRGCRHAHVRIVAAAAQHECELIGRRVARCVFSYATLTPLPSNWALRGLWAEVSRWQYAWSGYRKALSEGQWQSRTARTT